METNITTRWEKGIPHHSMSIKIFKAIEENDFKYGGDYFCFKSGGDGDNGEHLMYLLDIYFESDKGDENSVDEICVKHGLELESLEKQLREANQFCEIFKKCQIEFEKRIKDLETKLDVAIKSGEAWRKEALKENTK